MVSSTILHAIFGPQGGSGVRSPTAIGPHEAEAYFKGPSGAGPWQAPPPGATVSLARSLLVWSPMPRARVTVGIRDTTTGQLSTRTFDRSPILIGRGPWNTLSIENQAVAPLHGEIWFGPRYLAYLNLTSREPTVLDGRLLHAGELVRLRGRPVLVIGPYHIDVAREPTSIGHEEEAAPITGSATFATHALAIMANFASPLLELRRRLLLPDATASSDSNDPYEIVRSLLAPSSSSPGARGRSDA